MFLSMLTNTRWIPLLFILSIVLVYSVMPLAVNTLISPSEYFVELAEITLFASFGIAYGYFVPLFDSRFAEHAKRIRIDPAFFHVFIWAFFFVFLIITLRTASTIPLVSAINGASENDLSQERGNFLKARVGLESVLIYISTVFVSTLLPYSLAMLYMQKSRFRHLLLLVFFCYSISFLQKALFINVLVPLLYVATKKKKMGAMYDFIIIFGCSAALFFLIALAGGNSESSAHITENIFLTPDFYSSTYTANSTLDYMLWRIIAVPMFSASDTLWVFDELFHHEHLLGATSSLFSFLFSLDRINLERIVFAYEWGWNDIANSNAVYFTDAYVNFGWIGVFIFSFIVGQAFRLFKKSHDHAFKALCLIFCLNIFSGSLIGTLFSNGFILLFILGLFFKVSKRPNFS